MAAAQLRCTRLWSDAEAILCGAVDGPVPPPGGPPLAPDPELAAYFVIESASGADLTDIREIAASSPDVEIAYIEAGPTPPPVEPSDDPLSNSQGYLDEGPKGIGARWAWEHTDGAGIGLVDLEQGWTLDHEDLKAAEIELLSGVNKDYHGHGTAVLGEIAAVDNNLGVVGIAPGAKVRVVSQHRADGGYSTADAIASAAAAMESGDVLLIEAQTEYSTVPPRVYLPVEVESAVLDTIRSATRRGIVVIEAGGNGGINLDEFEDVNGRKILNRASADFLNSGAIVVAAASSSVPHSRSVFSNYGSRMDCFAWGEKIATCGDGGRGIGLDTYTSEFNGTSGASPMVAGAALLIQSYLAAHGRQRWPQMSFVQSSRIPRSTRLALIHHLGLASCLTYVEFLKL